MNNGYNVNKWMDKYLNNWMKNELTMSRTIDKWPNITAGAGTGVSDVIMDLKYKSKFWYIDILELLNG